jgi:DNA-binding MarR family transcriptional regulator
MRCPEDARSADRANVNRLTDSFGAPDYGGLDHTAGFLITLAQVDVYAHFMQGLAQQGLQPSQISALILIRRNPGIRHGTLAGAIRLKLAHMTKLINALESDGLVERRASRQDRRSVELFLTPAGEGYVDRLAPMVFEHDAARADGLTPDDRRNLVRLLRKSLGFGTRDPQKTGDTP